MGHYCPHCYSPCHCNGDIDDMMLDLDEDVARCTCCDEDEIEREDDWDEGYDYDALDNAELREEA